MAGNTLSIGSFGSKSVKDIFIDQKALNRRINKEINYKLNKILNAVTEQTFQIFNNYLINTIPWRGLLGAYIGKTDGSDLLADFGLASPPTDVLEDVIRDNFVVSATQSAVRANLGIQLSLTGYRAAISKVGWYDSDTSGEEVPWGGWMMRYNSALTPSRHGIMYGDDFGDVSRSGRAIMVRQNKPGYRYGRGIYRVPRFLTPKYDKAETFIEDILYNEHFRRDVKAVIRSAIARA